MPEITARLSTALADRYKIESHLGEGGMANVYLAEDLKHHRKVAVKVLRPELAAVLGAERFVQEIETTANLQHPHILPLFDSGEADSFLYYVMPFIDGETLRDKLNRETQLGIEEAVSITTAIADALDYAHRQNVIHRDIKPENILLHDGRPMVADFGIALALSAAAGGRMTETGMSLGTPHYMSPEQATAEKELTNRSDIYSLGCVLYEMLTGSPPHVGSTAQQIIMKIVTDEARPVTELRKSVPPHVAAATAKALEKLPADRFGTAKEFAEALTNTSFTLPTTQAAAVAGAAASGPWKRLSIATTGLATLFAIVALWGWLRPIAKPVTRVAVALPEEEALQLRLGPAIALSPDGSRMVYIGPGESGVQLWLRNRDQLHARPLPGTAGAFVPYFSPDGERVGFATTGPTSLKIVSLGGEPPITLADSGLANYGGAWGPDDYLYVAETGGLVRLPVDGGPRERVTALDTAANESAHFLPEALPSGKGVIFSLSHGAIDPENYDIAAANLATGEHRVLVRGVYARYAATGHLVFVRADGALLAAPFDQDRLELTGPATPLLDGVRLKTGGIVDMALSASGTLMYVAGAAIGGVGLVGEGEPVWVDREGKVEPVDPGWTFSLPGNRMLTLSADGTRLALNINTTEAADVWIKQLDRGPLSRLTFEGLRNIPVAWTPDGQSVVFSSNRVGSQDLYLKRGDGSGSAELLLDLQPAIWDATWSPDGQWLVFRTGGSAGERDLLGIRPGVDSVAVDLVATPFDEWDPAVSPDGRWLAYVSNESERSEVYVRPFPNTEDGRWQVSTDGGVAPLWAHSGKELFYRNGNEMVAAEVVLAPSFAVGEQRVLFSMEGLWTAGLRHYYAVSPDDQRFVMVRVAGTGIGDEAASAELILVENFLEELKARVGN